MRPLPGRVADEGIAFVGPTPEQLEMFGDKTAAKRLALQAGVPTLPGTEHGLADLAEVKAAAKRIGLPGHHQGELRRRRARHARRGQSR